MSKRKTDRLAVPQKAAAEAVTWLWALANRKTRAEMGPRYGIFTPKAMGVRVGDIQKVAKRLGKNHALALALWDTGWYEARMLASFVDEIEQVTPRQMDRWCRDFDNWGIVDTVCFKLFDRSPHAFAKVRQWSGRREEFVKRAAFTLLACVALHDKQAANAPFLRCLPLAERGARDERNFVKKGVSWALRAMGGRSAALHTAVMRVAERLAQSGDATCRWVGKDALRDLGRPEVRARLARRAARS
jgi:3-methyladenine DNA glycosylase AlkD